ncbi:hypothetical protein [Sulfitobacter donghicola]|uniref:Uncharacterized protein n=1 Tax=Sulfitobacter donghicola DSW-25 = KCTC 12864 = JCM 14565 TaxID=1300350 RepID=A0A073IUS5_9RHOB|nr:hypothetical protein [Sulfitobacter donghicola]KEJ89137.1 hypothetical protein DSW25_11635 [Sulfitobacter donghicola DSW-25 = KCTC 12864 = JCM 14565]KIN67566.1 hypothetical protein Z948_1281 [Sulfitobacter donghicola DSW-25 = KCTC 12864 = JCM 14565]
MANETLGGLRTFAAPANETGNLKKADAQGCDPAFSMCNRGESRQRALVSIVGQSLNSYYCHMIYSIKPHQPAYTKHMLLLALAKSVYDNQYKPEGYVGGGELWTFDNMCSGDLERAASVLEKSGFVSYIDDIGRRSVFNCGPEGFDSLANAATSENLSEEEIEEAVVWLGTGGKLASLEIERLAEQIEKKS